MADNRQYLEGVPYKQAAGDGGLRTKTQILLVMHKTDNTASATDEANYAARRPDQISCHVVIDATSAWQINKLDHVAYGCWPIGNSRSIQIEMCGRSDHDDPAVRTNSAKYAARICKVYGIPIKHLSIDEMRKSYNGIVGHGDITKAFGEGDHTDPGSTFPWTAFIAQVQAEYNKLVGAPAPTPVPPTPAPGGSVQRLKVNTGVQLDSVGQKTIKVIERLLPDALLSRMYVTSNFRSGPAYHGSLDDKGALDFAAGMTDQGQKDMRDAAQILYTHYNYFLEQIHTTPYSTDNGFYVKNYQKVGENYYSEAIKDQHLNHIHLASSESKLSELLVRLGPKPGAPLPTPPPPPPPVVTRADLQPVIDSANKLPGALGNNVPMLISELDKLQAAINTLRAKIH